MRTIIWIFIGLVCLIPVTFIAISLISAPSRDDIEAQKAYAMVWKDYADNRVTDLTSIPGDNQNAEFVRILADFLNKSVNFNSRLSQVKNNLGIMTQPQRLGTPQAIYELSELQLTYEKEIQSVRDEYEAAVTDLLNRTEALDKSKLILDTVSFAEGVNENKPKDEKELEQYTVLAQNVKALLEFVKTRNGYYQLGPDGFLHFTRPEDQEYYIKVMGIISARIKQIEDLREQNNKSIKQFVNDIPEIK